VGKIASSRMRTLNYNYDLLKKHRYFTTTYLFTTYRKKDAQIGKTAVQISNGKGGNLTRELSKKCIRQ